MFAEVIIPLYLNITYTWSIPAEWQNFVQPGLRVEVELRNKKYAGIIKAITNQKPAAFNPKPILSILDEEPLLHPQQLALWRWMAEYYVCTEGDIMQAAIPANLKLSSESILVWNEDAEVDLHDLTDNEFIVAQALEIKKQLTLSEVQQLLERRSVIAVIKTLIDKQIGFIWESLKDKYKAKTLTFVELYPTYRNDEALEPLFQQLAKAPKQTELLLAFLHLLKTEGVVTQSQLLQKANANAAQLKGLVDKKVLMLVKKAVDRIPFLNDHTSLSFQLSAAQQNALLAIEDNFKQKQVCLLHGVTASGKTLVYIQLMDSYVKQGLQVLFMLPEIALTAQMIRRVQKYFGQDIVIYHSKLNANERVEIWNKVRTKQVKVIMGARSALFLPYQQLGLIIVDEEHDASYKQQEPAPRYHARDVAVYYATLFNAKVLLGSATPSVETYFNTQSSVSNPQPKYGLVSLHERYGQVALPAIKVVDMKPLYSTTKKKTAFSPTLIEAVTQCLQNKKQAIIFQNRRGYSPYLICNTCGWIPECRHCDVTLTYHKAKHQLACHYCGTLYPVLHSCAACGSTNITQQNFGTERLEELLAELFPLARIARMDVDTVKGKNDHDMLIKQFEAQKIDILVGTQMVVKGLDFENVTLVGIVDGDSLLHFTDCRVNERAFQLMEQVSGRAGRVNGQGEVYIQMINTNHPVLGYVKEHNYEAFYQFEIPARQYYLYPPFHRMINIICKHKESIVAEQAANALLRLLMQDWQKCLVGPSQPPVPRVRNLFLWEIMCKLPKSSKVILAFKKAINEKIALLKQEPVYKTVQFIVDVDPV